MTVTHLWPRWLRIEPTDSGWSRRGVTLSTPRSPVDHASAERVRTGTRSPVTASRPVFVGVFDQRRIHTATRSVGQTTTCPSALMVVAPERPVCLGRYTEEQSPWLRTDNRHQVRLASLSTERLFDSFVRVHRQPRPPWSLHVLTQHIGNNKRRNAVVIQKLISVRP